MKVIPETVREKILLLTKPKYYKVLVFNSSTDLQVLSELEEQMELSEIKDPDGRFTLYCRSLADVKTGDTVIVHGAARRHTTTEILIAAASNSHSSPPTSPALMLSRTAPAPAPAPVPVPAPAPILNASSADLLQLGIVIETDVSEVEVCSPNWRAAARTTARAAATVATIVNKIDIDLTGIFELADDDARIADDIKETEDKALFNAATELKLSNLSGVDTNTLSDVVRQCEPEVKLKSRSSTV